MSVNKFRFYVYVQYVEKFTINYIIVAINYYDFSLFIKYDNRLCQMACSVSISFKVQNGVSSCAACVNEKKDKSYLQFICYDLANSLQWLLQNRYTFNLKYPFRIGLKLMLCGLLLAPIWPLSIGEVLPYGLGLSLASSRNSIIPKLDLYLSRLVKIILSHFHLTVIEGMTRSLLFGTSGNIFK